MAIPTTPQGAFDRGCAELHLTPQQCAAAQAALGGDPSKLRELAIYGVAGAAAGGCALIPGVGAGLAPVCGALGAAIGRYVVDLFMTGGSPTWYAPCAGPALDFPNDGKGLFWIPGSRASSTVINDDFARGFAKWPDAKAMVHAGFCGGGVKVWPNRSWFWDRSGENQLGYIDWPYTITGADSNYRTRCRSAARCLSIDIGAVPDLATPGHHLVSQTLPDIINSAQGLPQAVALPTFEMHTVYPPGTVAILDPAVGIYRILEPL